MRKGKKLWTLAGTALLSVALLTACGSDTKNNNTATGAPAHTIQKATKHVGTDVSFVVGKDGALKEGTDLKDKAIVDVYLDPLCPGCFFFENSTEELMEEQIKSGKVVVRYHPLMFLDANSTDKYSSRASAYLIGVADAAPDLADDFLRAIFTNHFYPTEENYRPTSNTDLDNLFKSIGGTEEQVKKVNDNLTKNMKSVYDKTLLVLKDKELSAKSPTGQMYTPFVIPNAPGKTDANAISIQGDVNETLKNAIEKALK